MLKIAGDYFSIDVNILLVVVVDELVDRDFELSDTTQQFRLELRLNGHEMILHLCRLHQAYSRRETRCGLYIVYASHSTFVTDLETEYVCSLSLSTA